MAKKKIIEKAPIEVTPPTPVEEVKEESIVDVKKKSRKDSRKKETESVVATPPKKEMKEKVEKHDEKKEDVDVFDLETVPVEGKEEISEVEQEIKKDEAQFEEEIQEERYYTVNLSRGFEKGPRWSAAKKSVSTLHIFLKRHMKPEGDVYISQDLNERIWERGIKHPPRKIRIRVTKSVDGIVRAYLA